MKDSVSEEDQIHRLSRVVNVMLTKIFGEFLGESVKVVNSEILLLSIVIISKDSLLDLQWLPLELEAVLKIALNNGQKPTSVLLINQPVKENSLSLMNPKTYEVFFVC